MLSSPFFLTNRQTNITYLHYVAAESGDLKRLVYIPKVIEKMPGRERERFRKKLILRFMWWSLWNKKQFKDTSDQRTISSRILDINSGILLSIASAWLGNRFLQTLDTPFLQIYFEDKKVKLPHIKLGLVIVGCTCGIYYSVQNVIDKIYLWDLALKYKENFAKGELVSENCEKILSPLQESA